MHEIDPFTVSRRRFLERMLTATVVVAATPSIVLGRIVPSIHRKNGSIAGRYRIDLNDPKYAALAEVGGSVRLDRMTGISYRIIVTRVEESTFVAVNATCTHEQCTVNKVSATSNGMLICPCHDSRFLPDGTVTKGPATEPLEQLETFFDGTSIVEVEVSGLAGADDDEFAEAFAGDVVVDRDSRFASVSLALEHSTEIRAAIYNVSGERLVEVYRGTLAAGGHELRAEIDELASGAFVFRIDTNRRSIIARKFVVTR